MKSRKSIAQPEVCPLVKLAAIRPLISLQAGIMFLQARTKHIADKSNQVSEVNAILIGLTRTALNRLGYVLGERGNDWEESCVNRHLLKQPATWAHLNLNPEPIGTSMDPESIERWYQEVFVAPQMLYLTSEPSKDAIHDYLKNRGCSRPASRLHHPPRRR